MTDKSPINYFFFDFFILEIGHFSPKNIIAIMR